MPSALVTTERSRPVSVLVIVTVTPGSTPPDESATVPSMEPLAAWDCANAGPANKRKRRSRRELTEHV